MIISQVLLSLIPSITLQPAGKALSEPKVSGPNTGTCATVRKERITNKVLDARHGRKSKELLLIVVSYGFKNGGSKRRRRSTKGRESGILIYAINK